MNLTRIQEENEQLREVLLNFTTELASNSSEMMEGCCICLSYQAV